MNSLNPLGVTASPTRTHVLLRLDVDIVRVGGARLNRYMPVPFGMLQPLSDYADLGGCGHLSSSYRHMTARTSV